VLPTRLDALSPRDQRRLVARAVVRNLVITALLVGAYVLAPVPLVAAGDTALRLLAILLISAGVSVWQVRAIAAARYPQLRAVEAVVLAVTVLLLFALLYLELAAADAATFNQHLDRVGALYFTVSVLTTVGFGDIVANSDSTRLIVTIQMLLDLTLVVVVISVFFAVARQRDTSSAEERGDHD
jgi:hypothetical protein